MAIPDWPTEEWIQRLNAADEEAFMVLFQICYNTCRHMVAQRSRLLSEQDSEDLAYEALEKVVVVLRKGKKIEKSFVGYAIQTARHCVLDRFRKQGSEMFPSARREELLMNALVPEADPETPRERAIREQLRECVKKLNDRDRQLIEWCLAEKPRAWIAQQFDPPKTENAINVQYHRIIRFRLKPCMEQAGFTLTTR